MSTSTVGSYHSLDSKVLQLVGSLIEYLSRVERQRLTWIPANPREAGWVTG